MWLEFWLRPGTGFCSSVDFFFVFSNWKIASMFMTVKKTCSLLLWQRNVLKPKKLLRLSLLLELTQDFPLPLREWTRYRKYMGSFFPLFTKKTLSGIWALFASWLERTLQGDRGMNIGINSNSYFDSFNFEIVSYFLQAGGWTLPPAPRLLERIESIWFYQPLAW